MKATLLFITLFFSLWGYSQINLSPTAYRTTTNHLDIKAVTYSDTPGIVGKHHKIEFGFSLHQKIENEIERFIKTNDTGLNPYNPSEIELEAIFHSPSGKKSKTYAFYYIPHLQNKNSDTWIQDTTSFNWRLRFAPDEVGNWKVNLHLNLNIIDKSEALSFNFECTPSNHKGYLKRSFNGDQSDRYLQYSETDNTFFVIGCNLPYTSYDAISPMEAERHKEWIGELAANGGNFFRVELGAQNALPDWKSYNDYTPKMAEMWEYDNLIEYAHSKDMYFTMFRHHVEVSENTESIPSWDGISWEENPYTRAFGLKKGTDYFTTEETIKWHQNTLRYIFSRWGYSPNFAIYEYQEIDRWLAQKLKNEQRKITDKLSNKDIKLFRDWYVQMKSYIRDSLDNSKILLSNTYAVTPNQEFNPNFKGLFSESDVVGFHKYAEKKDRNYSDRNGKTERIWKVTDKPFFVEEMGLNANLLQLYCCTDQPFHNDIWSTAFMGGTGIGLNWWWDRGIYDNSYHTQYKNLESFFKNEDLKNNYYTPNKWSDKNNQNKSTLSTYYLRSKSEEKVLGWVRNTTYHWRNLYATNACVKELVDNGSLENPCKYQDGYTPNKNGNPYNHKRYIDGIGKPIPIVNDKIEDNPRIVITGLKFNGARRVYPWAKKHWYKIEFFNTRTLKNGKLISHPSSVQILHTDAFSRLKPHVPNMTGNNLDWGYKIHYLGKFKKKPIN